ncbi:hypothetical protein PLESTM_000070100 [Pleodorina starrii]|nr:hypothetical protein PLESTM_000070100 [Pleodorina starrii]
MLRSSIGLRSGVSQSRVRSCIGLRSSRPVRQPCLGVCAFKDWFAGLVQQSREPQQPQHSQQSSATAVHEPPAAAPQALQPAPKIAPKRDFLEARQVSLSQLFDSSDYKFDVPTYQRPYAWRTKQIYELLQDFVKAYESRQEYFLGAIVATRAAEGANVPYQLIDGQQRLTSLVLLLAFLHGWARQQGNEVLEGRFRRMLYLEADPLDPASNGRYRLRLRDADDQFFRDNVLDAFLPHKYRLTGLAAEAEAAVTTTTGGGGGGAEVGAGVEAAEARPLENETWWRLYENASFLRGQLDKLVSEGLNLQDFAFHVLRNCFVVVMVARDEGASFRIFSTLNGRGMDLSMVDKLKADLLAGDLTPEERTHFAGAWAEMESVLGRSSFHRVFDHMRELAAVSDPRVGQTSVLEYFTRRVDDPAAVKQVLQVALDYARLLLQLRQASWATPELAALLAETPAVQHVDEPARSEAVQAVALEQTAARVLASEDVGRHEQHSRQWQNQDGGVALPAAAAAVLRADVEAAASSLPEKVAESAVEVEEEGGALVFRFDDPPAPAPISVAADAEGDELLVQPAAPAAASLDVGQIITRGPEGLDAAAEVHPVAEAAAGLQGSEARPEPDQAAAVALECMSAAVAVPQVDQQEHREDVPASWAASPAHEDVQQLESSVLQAAASAAAALEELRTQLREQAQQLLQEVQQQNDGLELQAEEDGAVLAAVVAEQEGQQPPQPQDPAAELQRQAALLAELDARSRHLNLFSDEAWLPPLLEFFYQTDDLQARAAFMKGAEALQLLLELQGDPAAKAARWGVVAGALLQRPFRPEAVLAALRLTEPERQAFRARLDSKDLYGTADQRTLRHLLVRCEPPSVSRSLAGLGGLLVERVVPQSAPEGSTWRKTRISSPCDPQSAWPDLWFSTNPSAAAAAEPATASHSSPEQLPAPSPTDAAPTSPSSSSSSSSYEVKYWYEVQRLNWHGKLGNLVLLPATAAGAASATADYDSKAAVWRQAGVVARLPGFTGPLVDERGRYGRFRFCYDECRQRHADMLEFLVAEFEL